LAFSALSFVEVFTRSPRSDVERNPDDFFNFNLMGNICCPSFLGFLKKPPEFEGKTDRNVVFNGG